MIPIQPWLVPLLVMTAILVVVAIVSVVAAFRSWSPTRVTPYLRTVLFGVVAVALIAGSVAILIFGKELEERITAILSFVSALVSAYFSLDSFLKVPRRPRRRGGPRGNDRALPRSG